MSKKISLTSYQSVSLFLQHYYQLRKKEDPAFSYAVWSQEIGLKSRGYLRLIMLGERPINEATLDAFMRFFKFSETDAEYFANLVNYSQSKNREQKKIFAKKILSAQTSSPEWMEVEAHYDFLSNPLLPRLQTLLSFLDAPQSSEKMEKVLGIDKNELSQAYEKLEELALIRKEFQENGEEIWRPQKRAWRLPNNFNDLAYKEFYIDTLQRAQKAIDIAPPDLRRFRSLFVAMNENEFKNFLSDFEIFIKEQSLKLDVPQIQSRRLYQLNFNFFPNTEVVPTSEESSPVVKD